MRGARPIWVFFLFLFSLALCDCGTPGVPQPPSLNLAKPVADLQATRTGNQVTLTWTVPTQTTDGAIFRHVGQTLICRAIDQPTMKGCASIAQLATPTTSTTESFKSDLPTDTSGPNDYVMYAVEVLNARGRSGGISNVVGVPAAVVSQLAGAPNFEVTPDAVVASVAVTLRDPAVSQKLELRRKDESTQRETVVATRPLDASAQGSSTFELRDETIVWEKTYEYRVVLVGSAQVPPSTTVAFDGDASAPSEVFVHDVFPPAVPSGLVAVSSGQFSGQQPAIDVTWNANTDRDLAGYFVYRRRQDETTAVKLNRQPVPAPSYHDPQVQPGNTYFYSVSAIDERGNESKRSEEASEQVPR